MVKSLFTIWVLLYKDKWLRRTLVSLSDLTESLKPKKITVLDATTQVKKDGANVTRFRLEGAFSYKSPHIKIDYSTKHISAISSMEAVIEISRESCSNLLSSPTMRTFLEVYGNGKTMYDLILHNAVNCECFLGLVPFFGNLPLVRILSMEMPHALRLAGHHYNPAYVTNFMHPYFVHPMSFTQRVANTLLSLYCTLMEGTYLRLQNQMARHAFGEGLPSIEEIAANASLLLINSHHPLDPARQRPPTVIDIKGFHIRKPQPLHQKFQSFIESAEHGVIYLSIGTKLLSTNMKKEKIDIFIAAFKDLREKVLWKWESDNSTDMPPNVFTSKWFPQNDILAHPKIKLFITHGGLFGVQEAIHYGVPMVVIPFNLDQHPNSIKIENLGYGVKLDYSTITAEKLKNAIKKVIYNQTYFNNIKHASRLFRDSPISPREKVVYWIEYVLRHKNLNHLRSPTAEMPLFQILLIDVIAFLLAILLISVISVYYTTKYIYINVYKLLNYVNKFKK